jgi:hypothetical protein
MFITTSTDMLTELINITITVLHTHVSLSLYFVKQKTYGKNFHIQGKISVRSTFSVVPQG